MHEVCLQRLPVVLALDRACLVGEDGATHHGIFDVAYLRVLPGIAVVSPKDAEELRAMLRWALQQDFPIALRYARGGIVCGEPLGEPAPVVYGQSEVLREGRHVAIWALGSLVYPALAVAQALAAQGIEATVVNARFVKPLDKAYIQQLGKIVPYWVSLEESQLAGGFGSALAEALDECGLHHVALHRIGLPDRFIEHGTRQQLLRDVGMDPVSLIQQITQWYHVQEQSLSLHNAILPEST
jgi:1-deoxy-D-xylulose-5-phosphate synthase